MELEDRSEYRCEHGVVAWWSKDGAWHIAKRENGSKDFYWSAHQYKSKDEAISALTE